MVPNEVIVAIIAAAGVVIAAIVSIQKGKNMAGGDGPPVTPPGFKCHALESQNISRELAGDLHRRVDGIFGEISKIKDIQHSTKNELHDLNAQLRERGERK